MRPGVDIPAPLLFSPPFPDMLPKLNGMQYPETDAEPEVVQKSGKRFPFAGPVESVERGDTESQESL